MNDSKILHACYTLAITTFFNFFLFQTLFYFEISKEISAITCAALSSIFIILSIFYTKSSISISLIINSIIMMLYVTFLYWEYFTGGYKFFIALALLIILLYSLYKILKK
jgi:hypothetical protein